MGCAAGAQTRLPEELTRVCGDYVDVVINNISIELMPKCRLKMIETMRFDDATTECPKEIWCTPVLVDGLRQEVYNGEKVVLNTRSQMDDVRSFNGLCNGVEFRVVVYPGQDKPEQFVVRYDDNLEDYCFRHDNPEEFEEATRALDLKLGLEPSKSPSSPKAPWDPRSPKGEEKKKDAAWVFDPEPQSPTRRERVRQASEAGSNPSSPGLSPKSLKDAWNQASSNPASPGVSPKGFKDVWAVQEIDVASSQSTQTSSAALESWTVGGDAAVRRTKSDAVPFQKTSSELSVAHESPRSQRHKQQSSTMTDPQSPKRAGRQRLHSDDGSPQHSPKRHKEPVADAFEVDGSMTQLALEGIKSGNSSPILSPKSVSSAKSGRQR
jgi:hypothetical protein